MFILHFHTKFLLLKDILVKDIFILCIMHTFNSIMDYEYCVYRAYNSFGMYTLDAYGHLGIYIIYIYTCGFMYVCMYVCM